MRTPRSLLLAAVFLAGGAIAPPLAHAAPVGSEAGDKPPTVAEVAVAAGALSLLSPANALVGALATLDTALQGAGAIMVRVRQTAAFAHSGTIACPVPGFTEVVDNFDEWRGSHRHTGVDIRASHGEPVRAVLPAVVIEPSDGSAYGTTVQLRDMAGNVWLYAHLSATAVRQGDRVAAGETLGSVGCTGRCTGPHLHIELHPGGGAPVDTFDSLAGACPVRAPAAGG